jgi:putative ABC transport system permease protein
MLMRKTLRDIWRQRTLVFTICLVNCIGVASFIASHGSYLDLSTSFSDTQDRLRLAPHRIFLESIHEKERAEISQIPGVKVADARLEGFMPVRVVSRSKNHAAPNQAMILEGKIISIPESSQPHLDQIHLMTGDLPGPDEILIERQVARFHGLGVGARVEVDFGGTSRSFIVSGVGTSAEHLWVTRDAQDILPGPHEFGLFWLGRGTWQKYAQLWLEEAGGKNASIISNLESIGMEGTINDVIGPTATVLRLAAKPHTSNRLLIELDRSQSAAAPILDLIKDRFDNTRVFQMLSKSQLPGIRLLRMDVDALRGIATFFPLFFLVVAGMMILNLLGRLIQTQRAVIGTMLALGIRRQKIFAHYLSFSVVSGLMGSLTGALLGLDLSHRLTTIYAEELGIPFVYGTSHIGTAMLGVAIGVGISMIAGYAPARRASQLDPAETMKPITPKPIRTSGWLGPFTAKLPLLLKVPMRNLARFPTRAIGGGLGIAAANLLVLVTGFIFNSIEGGVYHQTEKVFQHDLLAYTATPVSQGALIQRLENLSGIEAKETVLNLPVTIKKQDRQWQTLLVGVNPAPVLLFPLDGAGRHRHPSQDGVLLARSIAAEIGAEPGDEIQIVLQGMQQGKSIIVEDVTDLGPMTPAVMDLIAVQEMYGLTGHVNTLLLKTDTSKHDAIRDVIAAGENILRVQDMSVLRSKVKELMGLGYLLSTVMLVLAVILASVILYNLASIGVWERRRELATLLALGQPFARVYAWLSIELLFLAIIGAIAALPISLLIATQVLGTYTAEFMPIPFVMSGSTILLSCGSIAVAVLVSLIGPLRALALAPYSETLGLRE